MKKSKEGNDMSTYYDGRVCHPLTLYEEAEYRVRRTKHAEIYIEERRVSTRDEEYIFWGHLKTLRGFRWGYTLADRKEKLARNKEWAEKGRVWIARWKELLSGPMWKVRCDDWDGRGTPCPIQRPMESGEMGCPIRFFYLGYGGGYPPTRSLPGMCDGPLNSTYSTNVCVPSGEDVHGFIMSHLALVRRRTTER